LANSLLLLFICWELVGFASYMLIGFWYHKPSAAAAAKKAFITTRIGDVFFFLGLLWLYAESGTLLFYDGGNGCLEQSTLTKLVAQTTLGGMAVSTAVSLLIFCGAIGKSGQVPLHVWLPDAMEGPTPVSALIHAATMVAAGVFLVARVYPLMAVSPPQPTAAEVRKPPTAVLEPSKPEQHDRPKAASSLSGREAKAEHPASHPVASISTALQAVTWIGAITAVFAALIAVAQTDIKRILAYSTVSQLGYMMVGLGVGGVAVGMFHLLTHAFFKALLFLGAGSVIHGCHEEQDIRFMGGLRRFMPITFATYAIGMMALAGVPLFFSGFWSKDEILHAAWLWQPSKWPFLLSFVGAFLTAFYMTRQMWFVFFGESRTAAAPVEEHLEPARHRPDVPHESPPVMTFPLAILAVCTILLGAFGTPIFPWFQDYLSGEAAHVRTSVDVGVLLTMLASTFIVAGGIGLGWWLYRRQPRVRPEDPDALEKLQPDWFAVLRGKFFIDELYEISFLRWNAWCARTARWMDEHLWESAVLAVSLLVLGLSWLNRLIDEFVVNLGFNQGCGGLRSGARLLSLWQNGQIQRYLRVIGLGLVVFGLVFIRGYLK
jgi:NADH-quinone oxidoreductase subunit L